MCWRLWIDQTTTPWGYLSQVDTPFGEYEDPITFPVLRKSVIRSLSHFPHDFLPLTIVVGDRREVEPKTAGDLFALFASPAELRWLLRLGLPDDVEIVSDKVFRMADHEYLVSKFGSQNLLLVGSPAANLVSRVANDSAFFPFAIDPSVRTEGRRISAEIDKFKMDRAKLTSYALGTGDGLRFFMNGYRQSGFIDPVFSFFRKGDTIPRDGDYGVVTLCRNPYEPVVQGNCVCIMAAGVHLPGTMYAVQRLSEARTLFKERPLGGVFSVKLNEVEWVQRLSNVRVEWSTDPYTIARMYDGLERLMSKLEYAPGLDKASIEDRIAFLDSLTGTTRTTEASAG